MSGSDKVRIVLIVFPSQTVSDDRDLVVLWRMFDDGFHFSCSELSALLCSTFAAAFLKLALTICVTTGSEG